MRLRFRPGCHRSEHVARPDSLPSAGARAVHAAAAGYTHKPDQSKLRNQSIRLVVNQLFTPHPHLRARIVAHANQLLDALALPSTLEDLPEIVVNVVVPPMPIYDKIILP